MGLAVGIKDDRVSLSPRDKITTDIVALVKEHKKELLKELKGQTIRECKSHTDPFVQFGAAIKVYLPPLDADVWWCADERAKARVEYEELACFLYEDLVYIHQGKPGAERLSRLHEVYAMRRPLTEEVLTLFDGKIKSIKAKGEPQ